MPSRLYPVTTINMSLRFASASWMTKSPTRHGVVFGVWIRLMVRPEQPARRARRSVRNGGPRLAPPIKVRAAPRDRARAESNSAWELLVGDQAVDRRPPKARHPHDGRHAQKDSRCYVGTC